MPRFSYSENFASPSAENSFPSALDPRSPPPPGLSEVAAARLVSSVRIGCLTPNGRAFHALNLQELVLETYRLPLEQTREGRTDEDDNNGDLPVARVRTILPDTILAALAIDPPLELLCVEGQSTIGKNPSEPLVKLPKLCLYTRKSAFLFQIAYPKLSSSDRSIDVVQGEIVSLEEPFESFLLGMSFSHRIIRIRAAPQQSAGYAFLTPPDSMAMLTTNKETNECCLTLYHGSDRRTTTPFVFLDAEEEIDGGESDQVVDFCFAKSRGLSVFSSLSVLLLKLSGDVLSASPLVFHGSVVARSDLEEGLDFLAEGLGQYDRATAKWRQFRAAQQFLVDIFPIADRRNHFCTARTGINSLPSASWPIQVQGPIIFRSETEPGPPSLTIENFGHVMLVSIAIGKVGGHVDFAMVSPSVLLPRFGFESKNDSYDLDGESFKLSSIVERVSLGQQQQGAASRLGCESQSLLADPLVDTLMHVAMPKMVATISTNAIRIASRRLEGDRDPGQVRTNAWCCLNVASNASHSAVRGVVVTGDLMMEHEIIARLDDGTMIPVNVTETQFLNEIEAAFSGSLTRNQGELLLASSSGASNAADEALRSMQSTKPLYEVLEPIIAQVKSGLAGMGKIVGSETSYKDITPDALAVAVKVKERCDKEIVLPLLELKKAIEKRQEKLRYMLKGQQQQAADLQQTLSDLKKRMVNMTELMSIAESNATRLSESSTRLHQACLDLRPTVTEAEFEFFNDIKQL